MTKWKWLGLISGAVLVLAAGAFGGYLYATQGKNTGTIPSQVSTNLTFSPFALAGDAGSYSASDYKFSTAEGDVQILTYLIHTQDGTTITVSQYAQPPEFNDIPEYKDRFLTNVAKQYDTVQTSNGTVYLGRMTKQDNKQLAVMTEKGLLVLMNPDKEMSQAQWRSLVERLEIQKTS